MDQGIIGSIYTVVVFLVFIGIVWWAFSKKSKKGFDEAANLIFDKNEQDEIRQEKQESYKK